MRVGRATAGFVLEEGGGVEAQRWRGQRSFLFRILKIDFLKTAPGLLLALAAGMGGGGVLALLCFAGATEFWLEGLPPNNSILARCRRLHRSMTDFVGMTASSKTS